MSYTDDAVLAKLSALNESQDSIATAAQWVMFHRRHAERTVQIWLQRLKDSPSPKRLNLVYLANEVIQQTKARHKEEFLLAFSPVIADATSTAFKGASSELQGKLRRVVDVWKDRGIFEAPIQAAIEARLEELDKTRSTTRSGFGGSIGSSSSVPPELGALVTPQQNINKLLLSTKSAVKTADADFDRIMDPSIAVPSPPVLAARLNGLLRNLASAEGAVAQGVKARNELVTALEKLLGTNRAELAREEGELRRLTARRADVERSKDDVERAIMSGLAAGGGGGGTGEGDDAGAHADGALLREPDRPEVEALTPPLPPQPDDAGELVDAASGGDVAPPQLPEAAYPQQASTMIEAPDGAEPLPGAAPPRQHPHALPVSTNGSNKRRRVDTPDDFPDLGGDGGIDADVAEMLRKDSSQAS